MMPPPTLHLGDVFDVMAGMADQSVDLIVTSPPFLALRSYLPADHPDKGREIGAEATPAAYIGRLLDLTAEWRRLLRPTGSLCVELGDTYAGSGGGGGDYLPGGMREGQQVFAGSASRERHSESCDMDGDCSCGETERMRASNAAHWRAKNREKDGWPLAKSLTGVPTIYPWSLAYGRNLLTGEPSPAGRWRIRNLVVWARPNPPVGALGDKFRPATSYITVACTGADRYFDLDAVRTPHTDANPDRFIGTTNKRDHARQKVGLSWSNVLSSGGNSAGAPPLDWSQDLPDDSDGDWLWRLTSQPYSGAHYATFPEELPRRLIRAMCPPGGTVLDPFAGSGTTLKVAFEEGRHAVGIDLDERNADLARERVGMFLDIA